MDRRLAVAIYILYAIPLAYLSVWSAPLGWEWFGVFLVGIAVAIIWKRRVLHEAKNSRTDLAAIAVFVIADGFFHYLNGQPVFWPFF